MKKVSEESGKWYSFEQGVLLHLLNMARDTRTREVHLFGSYWPLPAERQFSSINEVQVYLDGLITKPEFKEKFPRLKRRILVKAGEVSENTRAGEAWAVREKDSSKIILPDHSVGYHSEFMREWFVLHELAHHLSGMEKGHSTMFRKRMWELTSLLWGPQTTTLFQIMLHQAETDS